jgi:hypothetical protein
LIDVPIKNLGGLRSGIFWPASSLVSMSLSGAFLFLPTNLPAIDFGLVSCIEGQHQVSFASHLVHLVWGTSFDFQPDPTPPYPHPPQISFGSHPRTLTVSFV